MTQTAKRKSATGAKTRSWAPVQTKRSAWAIGISASPTTRSFFVSEPMTSYVSIVELGMYEMTGKLHQQLGAKHKPGSDEFEAARKEFTKHSSVELSEQEFWQAMQKSQGPKRMPPARKKVAVKVEEDSGDDE